MRVCEMEYGTTRDNTRLTAISEMHLMLAYGLLAAGTLAGLERLARSNQCELARRHAPVSASGH